MPWSCDGAFLPDEWLEKAGVECRNCGGAGGTRPGPVWVRCPICEETIRTTKASKQEALNNPAKRRQKVGRYREDIVDHALDAAAVYVAGDLLDLW